MAPTPSMIEPSAVDRVRQELLTALHFGKLTPGDRAPSVRGLARRTGMDKKTVHRAYTRLAREGLVDIRPGSGTFITEQTSPIEGAVNDLLSVVNRCKATAATLGLAPELLGAFLGIYFGEGLRGLPLTVTECNGEQLGLIQTELQARLGVNARTTLLSELPSRPSRALEVGHGIVTTDCHLAEVSDRVSALGLPVYRVALDPSFPRRVASAARRSRVVMIVRDRRFEPVFLGLLERLSVDPDCLGRIRVLDVQRARYLLPEVAGNGATVLISPLVEREVSPFVPAELPQLRMRWEIEASSMKRLKASLALDVARRRQAASRVPG